MDDLSRLLARLFGRFVGQKDEENLPLDREALTGLVHEQNKTIEGLEDRLKTLESDQSKGRPGGKVINHPALAAE